MRVGGGRHNSQIKVAETVESGFIYFFKKRRSGRKNLDFNRYKKNQKLIVPKQKIKLSLNELSICCVAVLSSLLSVRTTFLNTSADVR